MISVLIPAHNEEGNLTPLVQKLACTFDANHLDAEVVLVDDGSTDGTHAEADALATEYPFLHVIHQRRNRVHVQAFRGLDAISLTRFARSSAVYEAMIAIAMESATTPGL